jgi:glycosyltransferase involved in cell wall biosynthesis
MSERRFRVVHVITRLIVGGAQENTILSCRGFIERGYDVTLVTGPETGSEGSLQDQARTGCGRVIVVDSLRRDPHPLRDFLALVALVSLFRRLRPDIVHTHSSKAGILGRAAAWIAGVPVIIHTNHGMPFHDRQPAPVNWLWRLLEKLAARVTRRLICVGETVRRASIRARLAPAEKHEVVYSGMELPSAREYAPLRAKFRGIYGLEEGAPVIGWLGRMAPQKGPRDFLEVLESAFAARPDARAIMVGDGPMFPGIVSAVRAKPWASRFSFGGGVSPVLVPGHLAAMDVFVLTSHWEGLPRTAVQAALAGLPVVAYDVEGASEVVRSGETGFLVPVGDRRALADRVIEVLSMPDRGRAMGLRGREILGDRFDARRMVDALDRIYRECR